jgi:orotate phosphoribosyltransferase-like protein
LAKQPKSGPWLPALDAAWQNAENSQRWRSVVADWSACLQRKGLTPDLQHLAPQGVDWKAVGERTVRPQDIELAVADVACKEQTNTVHRLADVVAAAQAPVIAKYHAELLAQRTELDAQVAKARKVLGDAGL